MPTPSYALVQANEKLYQVTPAGVQTEIGLPAGVTVSAFRPVRGAILNRRLVLVNGVSRNLQLDANLVPVLLQPTPPQVALSSATGAAGNLTGTYYWRYTFAIMSGDVVLAESDLSPVSTEITLSADQASLTAIGTSSDPGVNARRIYRTASDGGDDYFLVTTLHDNSTTTYTDNSSDESLDLFPIEEALGPVYGAEAGSRLTLIATWKDRLWAVPDTFPDRVHFSGNRLQYAWNEDYYLVAGAEGADFTGVTGLAPRRNELVVGKKRSLHKITGDSVDDFGLYDIVGSAEGGVGFWATDSVVVIRDAVYFLAEDGVYRWDGRLTNLSRDLVHPWFTTSETFNRGRFDQAFAHYNAILDTYELFLPSTDSLVCDRWVSFDLATGEWLGPHKTDAYTPQCAAVLDDSNGLSRPAVGASNGGIYLKNAATYTDAGTAIAFRAKTNPHHQGEPDLEKFWGELTVHNDALATGTLTVKAQVGDLEAPQGTVAIVSMTRAGSVVTVQTNGEHHFGTGQAVTIADAGEADYNGIWEIVRTSSTAFTFDIGAATPASPASGSPTALLPIRGDLTTSMVYDRNRLGRLGTGRFCQLTFENAENNQACTIRGYEIEPVNILGRR